MIYTTKRFSTKTFSTAGREWAGFKGGMKGAMNGALLGAGLAPGNLIAYGLGHKKTALGITAAGSLIGGGIGFKYGRDKAINEYKYKTDPDYKKKIDKEENKRYKKKLEYSLNEDMIFSEEFSYQGWKKLNLPKEILDYIKFYDTTWKNKIPKWYSETGTPRDIVEFKEIFPMPIDMKTAKEWLDDSQELIFLTVNDAGDDGWGVYNLETKRYGWDTTNYGYETSFKKFIYKNVDKFLKENVLTETQIRLAQEFKRNIK